MTSGKTFNVKLEKDFVVEKNCDFNNRFNEYSYIFDGNNKKINFSKEMYSIFPHLSGEIKNVTFVFAKSGNSEGKWITERIVETGKLNNVILKSKNSNELFSHGFNFAEWNYGSIDNCKNYINRSNVQNCGGIVDYNYGRISNCNNYGNINGLGIGGIVYSAREGTIENCKNFGNLIRNGSIAGGIASDIGMFANNDTYIINCANYGNVEGEKLGTFVGEFKFYSSVKIIITGCTYLKNDTINTDKDWLYSRSASDKTDTDENIIANYPTIQIPTVVTKIPA